MKTNIVLIPTLGNSICPEMKEEVFRFLGLMNTKLDSNETYKLPRVTYNGILPEEQKQALKEHVITESSSYYDDILGILFIEFDENRVTEDISTLTTKEK